LNLIGHINDLGLDILDFNNELRVFVEKIDRNIGKRSHLREAINNDLKAMMIKQQISTLL
jgi:hypothetical protein